MSLTDRILPRYILSQVRVSVRPSNSFICEKLPKLIVTSGVARAHAVFGLGPNGTPTCPGLISQRRALISKRLALICPGQWAPNSYVRALPGRAPMCWSALPFKVLSAYSRSNTGSVQNHQKPDEDHKTDPRFLFCGVPRW